MLSKTTAATLTDYTIETASNRLINTTTGSSIQNYRYDAAGNTVNDGKNNYTYNARGRLIKVSNAKGITQFTNNGLGQRTRKTTSAAVRRFMYDEAGHLIGEYNYTGQIIREHIYLGDTPVATLSSTDINYIYADHLNAPHTITNNAAKTIWQWNTEPFGVTLANTDPDGDGIPFEYNLRFSGQYFDTETGLHYNYFRDYNPNTGRYVESDPIGLDGGINTYSYVGGNPVNSVDPLGLEPDDGDDATEWCRKKCAKDGFASKYGVAIPLPGKEIQVCNCDQECPLDKDANDANNTIKDNYAKKIFGDREGHLPDTPENRKLLEDVANDPSTTLGKDKFGNEWSEKTNNDGTQLWTQSKNGNVINGGLNNTPRSYNPETGLSSSTRPNWK